MCPVPEWGDERERERNGAGFCLYLKKKCPITNCVIK